MSLGTSDRTRQPSRWTRGRWLLIVGAAVAAVGMAANIYVIAGPGTRESTARNGPLSETSFTATTFDGERLTVPDGKPAVVFFFSVGCGFCGPGARAVGEAQREDADAAHFVAVDVVPTETPEIIRDFLTENRADGVAFASEPDGRLISAYQITQLSTVAITSSAGDVVYRAVDPTASQIRTALAKVDAK